MQVSVGLVVARLVLGAGCAAVCWGVLGCAGVCCGVLGCAEDELRRSYGSVRVCVCEVWASCESDVRGLRVLRGAGSSEVLDVSAVWLPACPALYLTPPDLACLPA